jgi:hypothetical protein
MTCMEAAGRAIDHLYGELAGSERRSFEVHLAGCESCRREREALERTRRSARTALLGPLSQAAPGRIHGQILKDARQEAERLRTERAAAPPEERATRAAAVRDGVSAWLRRPWFLPAFATVSLLAIFFIARPMLTDGPRRAFEQGLSRPAPMAAREATAPTLAPTVGPPDDETARPAPAAKRAVPVARRRKAQPDRDIVLYRDQAGLAEAKAVTSKSDSMVSAPAPPRAEPRGYRLQQPEPKPPVSAADLSLRLPGSEAKSGLPAAAPPGGRAQLQPFASGALPVEAADSLAPLAPPLAPMRAFVRAPSGPAASAPRPETASAVRPEQLPAIESLIEKADRLFVERRWQLALDAYRELLRRFPIHPRASEWRRQSDTAIRALAR